MSHCMSESSLLTLSGHDLSLQSIDSDLVKPVNIRHAARLHQQLQQPGLQQGCQTQQNIQVPNYTLVRTMHTSQESGLIPPSDCCVHIDH